MWSELCFVYDITYTIQKNLDYPNLLFIFNTSFDEQLSINPFEWLRCCVKFQQIIGIWEKQNNKSNMSPALWNKLPVTLFFQEAFFPGFLIHSNLWQLLVLLDKTLCGFKP